LHSSLPERLWLQNENHDNLPTLNCGIQLLVGPRDAEYGSKVAFPADDSQIAVLSMSLITIHSIMHPGNRLSFDPGPKEEVSIYGVLLSEHVICSELRDSDEISGLLQVWKLKDHTECTLNARLLLIFKKTRPYSWHPMA